MANTRPLAILGLAAVLSFFAGHISAQRTGTAERHWADDSPSVVVPQVRIHRHLPPTEVRLEAVRAEIEIDDQVATTAIELTLRNPGPTPREAQVLLPLPDGVAVKSMQFDGAGVEPIARLLPRDEARRIYDSIVNRRRDPALLEFAGYNLVRTSVFPIPAGGQQRVTITYEEVLERDGARIDYTLPRSQSLEPLGVSWEARIRVKSKTPIGTLYSPSHELLVENRTDRRAEVRFSDHCLAQPGSLRLSIVLQQNPNEFWGSVITCPDLDGKPNSGYFMLLSGAPTNAAPRHAKREVVLVFDRSGSMRGKKLDQAKAAAMQVLEGLHDGEYFNIIDYSDSIASYADKSVLKNDESLRDARAYVRSITAGGGTNIHGALAEALRAPTSPGSLPMVLFLTDGLPTVGERNELRIREMAESSNIHNRRIFAFGLGLDVNAPLLTAISRSARGASTFVLPEEDVEGKVTQVFRRLDGPVMQSPRLLVRQRNGSLTTRFVRDVVPAQLPDFFAGDQVVILGRWEGNAPHSLVIEDGSSQGSFSFDLTPASASHRNSHVARLWATRKIALLLDEVHAMGASGSQAATDPRFKELVDEIVSLSTRFGVLTEYTSFLATEPGLPGEPPVRGAAPAVPMSAAPGRARDELARKSIEGREGAEGVAQQLNVKAQREVVRAEAKQSYIAADMKERQIGGVQQVGDRALFYRANRWVDSDLLKDESAPPEKTVEFGTPEFSEVVTQLAAEGRQGLLARGGDVYLKVQGKRVLVRCP